MGAVITPYAEILAGSDGLRLNFDITAGGIGSAATLVGVDTNALWDIQVGRSSARAPLAPSTASSTPSAASLSMT